MQTKKWILIVDDDDDDTEILCEALHQVDSTVKCITAYNGKEALQLLRHNESLPNFIFLDLSMPKMSGKQCLAAIKKIKNLSSIPVVIYTTSKREQDIEETDMLGADFFLTKPFVFEELCKSVSLILKGKKNIIVL